MLIAVACFAALARPSASVPSRPQRTELSHPCSRKDSRVIRARLEKEVLTRSDVAGAARKLHTITWPEGCPLHPARDLWGNHERAKSRVGPEVGRKISQEWRCAFSNRSFKSEHYADLHMERNYMNETPPGGACLADYCDSLAFCYRKPEPSWAEAFSSDPPGCDPAELRNWQTKCTEFLSHCVLHANISGLPDANMTHVERVLHGAWCAPLTCESRATRHSMERRQLIIASAIGGVFLMGITICCFMAKDDEPPRSKKYYHHDRRFPSNLKKYR